MIGRRAAILAGTGLFTRPAAAALPVPPGNRIAFAMIRHNNDIGRHIVTFERKDSTLTVRVSVDAQVTFLSIPVVRYNHRAVEIWNSDTLVSLNGETNRNGQHQWMNAHRSDAGLEVLGSATAAYIAPENALGITYWNKHQLEVPMIGMDDGLLQRPRVAFRETENIPLAAGGTVAANHYNLSGAFSADVWYDRSNAWAGFAFPIADTSIIHYERL
jgi:hypothetical protein